MICHYYLTYRCSCRCEFCRISNDSEFEGVEEAGIYTIEKNLDSLVKLGVKSVNFTGGEPLLRHDIKDILSIAKKKGLHVALFTGGLDHPEKLCEMKGLLDELYIPLDAPGEEEHNRIRGQECYAEAVAGISLAKKMGMDVKINFTVTRDSVRSLPEMVDLAQHSGVTLRINPVHHFFGFEGFEKISVDYILRYARRKNVEMNRAVMELLKHGGNDKNKPVCRALETTVTISPDDHLILPCINSFQARIPIDGKLEKVMNSDIIKGYKKLEGRMDACAGCADIDYMIPSFSCKINKYRLLDLISSFDNMNKKKDA
ncbi:MAG: radical SAM protein [Candidatus Saganbacteria bacterium]|nr:radical SAM protein [Candidatus Saganbacteria bacterium]